MKTKMVVDFDPDTADQIVRESLFDSIGTASEMVKYYEQKLAEIDKDKPNYTSRSYFMWCLKDHKKDLKALKRVHNYYTPAEEHVA